MAWLPEYPCTQPGCKATQKEPGKCPKHKEARLNLRRGKVGRRIYDLQRWKITRKLQLAIEPLCRRCAERGEYTAAGEVDHIKPIEEGGDPWKWENLQSLCHACHSAKTLTDANVHRGGG